MKKIITMFVAVSAASFLLNISSLILLVQILRTVNRIALVKREGQIPVKTKRNEKIERMAVDEKAKIIVCERLHILNEFILSKMTHNFSGDASEELHQLMMDKAYFIESTRISFSIEHPKFIECLKKKGLSDSEIGYCCFYAMGLKGKDISSYMGNGHYKISSAIRKKIGLGEHDTNLDIYIRGLLSETHI